MNRDNIIAFIPTIKDEVSWQRCINYCNEFFGLKELATQLIGLRDDVGDIDEEAITEAKRIISYYCDTNYDTI